ncbi:hypothetical protein GZ77_21455 [Endozoicomonas montiporae]|uniref:Methyltransferase type 11 domain-containing protein n=2 Tax=Endozoicomonas montiporae TaxID=1027273 RepID=A0A081N3G8_9GAMM|nr:class I SAM-dependent methyltransferase [Endozoicomonas montiporae]AMO58298.1 methylase involved in ubiquinone/menaquinone biosynthesis [Endozoicomonas montiporae CL-33]KEQ12991.1 hypothetical protein GZ77_21455 [Endozoicomonas montiporae]
MAILTFFLGIGITWLVMSGLLSQIIMLLVRIWFPSSRTDKGVVADQWLLNSGVSTSSRWRLLGYWHDTANYRQACSELAGLLADKACLSNKDKVLDMGFTSYDQLLVWLDYYQVESLTAATESERMLADAHDYCGHFGQLNLERGNVSIMQRLDDESFDKVLALDCAYHMADKKTFFQQARRVLRKGGAVTLTDMVLARPFKDRLEQRMVTLMARTCGIPVSGLYVTQVYESMLNTCGFEDVQMTDISEDVLSGFCFWFSQHYGSLSSVTRSKVWIRLRLLVWFIRWMQHRGLLRYHLVTAR